MAWLSDRRWVEGEEEEAKGNYISILVAQMEWMNGRTDGWMDGWLVAPAAALLFLLLLFRHGQELLLLLLLLLLLENSFDLEK